MLKSASSPGRPASPYHAQPARAFWRRGVAADPGTAQRLSEAVVDGLGVPFRPSRIVFVPELPKTRNMKIMRRVVRAVWLGQSPGDLSSLVNPHTVDQISALRDA